MPLLDKGFLVGEGQRLRPLIGSPDGSARVFVKGRSLCGFEHGDQRYQPERRKNLAFRVYMSL